MIQFLKGLITLYTYLGPGDLIQEGDEMFGIIDKETLSAGWIRLDQDHDYVGQSWNRNMLKVRRRRARTTSKNR